MITMMRNLFVNRTRRQRVIHACAERLSQAYDQIEPPRAGAS